MFIERKIYPELKKHLEKRQITVITGMRRTGKTTLVKQLLKVADSENKVYIDLERIDNREIFGEKNYDNIIRSLSERGLDFSKKAYIALDEIQLAPEIPSALKYLYDNYDIKFVVTGSSSYYLKNLFGESLAGRKKIFELYPLDFGEFLTFKGVPFTRGDFSRKTFLPSEYERVKSYYGEYVKYGGFPEVALTDDRAEKKDIVSDIISSYVNIDIKSLSDFRSSKNIYNLMKVLAGRIGTRLDYSKIARITGLSRPTVLNYVDFFEKTYLIKRIPVLARRPDREIVKAQKLYFCDNGIANMLFELSGGAMFENAVFNQLRGKGSLRYYSLKTGREIDFILDNSLALEVKESPTSFDLEPLRELAKSAGVKKFRLVGRNPMPKFTDYVWGGDIK